MDEKKAKDEYLADLQHTKELYHLRNPEMAHMHEHKKKLPKDDCAAIQTSYGGKWIKRRCSFRHYFLCNNPSKVRTNMNMNMMGMNGRGMNRMDRRRNRRFGRNG